MSFAEEFKRLQLKMPRIALQVSQSENSEYTNYAFKNKNCYLIFGSHYNEDTLYAQYVWKNTSCVDCDKIDQAELCYECTYGGNLYNCNYCFQCFSCSDCEFSYDLVNCKNCFLCANLRNTEYYIRNRAVTKERYKEEIQKLKSSYSLKQLIEEREKIRQTVPHINVIQKNCENCLGSYLENCKNCLYCYNATNAWDCIYLETVAHNLKDCIDCGNIGYDPSELLYECIGINGGRNFNFCYGCWHSSDLEYCELVFNSHDCFGCISRNHAEYEILNQKYSKDNYFKKVRETKEELKRDNLYGKWLLQSAYPYEDTIAPLYFQ